MDPLDDLLQGVRADGAGFGRTELSPPWALRFTDGASLTLSAPLHGEAWIALDDGSPEHGKAVLLKPGDCAIVRGPAPFTVTDRPRPDSPRAGAADPPPPASTVLLTGTYQVRGRVSARLLDMLPPLLVVPGTDGCASLGGFLDSEAAACRPGRQVVLDRLLDWLLVCTLRGWFDSPQAAPLAWYGALGDEVTGPALRAMHRAPEHPWTLAALAAEAAVSRTTLAARFTRQVGKPPLAYLTDWRMTLAADLLTGSTATVAAVARQVGYADAFGFSTAFKRVHGVSPSEYRRACGTADCAADCPA
ncbi:AraC family transcriptional regulator [Streptomyces sp. JB150]|uniref:AraC family transcriptional regulator n=1 Tax=Streptomyces sp. JB150 TaxID=2714844 RepID=UPI00140BF576|nr:AraC family transcriptional regulator [Streptomyces sp. JB150]QIJ60863.1 AraC family transcriptional regulator [Streptomyces sp. JB150]